MEGRGELWREGKALPSFPTVPLLTAWFVTTSRTKSIPSGSGICTPRQVRSAGGTVSSVQTHPAPPLTSPPPSSQPPDPTIEHWHHCNLQQGLQRGLQWYQLGVGRQEVRAVRRDGLAFTALPRPQPCAHAPPSQLTASDSSADWFE